jgi:hypothetical protein
MGGERDPVAIQVRPDVLNGLQYLPILSNEDDVAVAANQLGN